MKLSTRWLGCIFLVTVAFNLAVALTGTRGGAWGTLPSSGKALVVVAFMLMPLALIARFWLWRLSRGRGGSLLLFCAAVLLVLVSAASIALPATVARFPGQWAEGGALYAARYSVLPLLEKAGNLLLALGLLRSRLVPRLVPALGIASVLSYGVSLLAPILPAPASIARTFGTPVLAPLFLLALGAVLLAGPPSAAREAPSSTEAPWSTEAVAVPAEQADQAD